MKYESAILKRLIDTYGVVGNPCYTSEIIKEFIVQGKECFPNLFTYQSDWLTHIDEFGLNPSYTVTYTGQSIYAPNTLERSVKSAILLGQTLVNICKPFEFDIQTTGSGLRHLKDNVDMLNIPLDDNKKYSVWVEIDINEIGAFSVSHTGRVSKIVFDPITDLTLTGGSVVVYPCVKRKDSDNTNFTIGAMSGSTEGRLKGRIMVFEGDVRGLELSYFDGMKSVQMPVLSTVGKNLFNEELFFSLQDIGFVKTNKGFTTNKFISNSTFYPLKLKPNTTYSLGKLSDNQGGTLIQIKIGDTIYTTNNNGDLPTSSSFTTDNTGIVYIRGGASGVGNIGLYTLEHMWIVEGAVKGTYEPFKTNILTVNEEVELRSIGDVQDTLNCLTGEVTERIGEIVLDGSEDWSLGIGFSDNENGNFECKNINIGNRHNKVISTHFNYDSGTDDRERVRATNSNYIVIYINKTRLESPTVDGFKKWLITQKNSGNPVKVQYQLLEKSIKTVDLTILDQNGQNVKQLMSFNGGTHFNTMSTESSPLPTVIVSVETDLEETLKRCSLEGNTL